MVATVVKVLNQDQYLFKLSRPITYSYYDVRDDGLTEDTIRAAYYVISSRTKVFELPEVYLFEANSDGEFIHMDELPGSIKGCFDLFQPFKDLGYNVVVPPTIKVLYGNKDQ